MAIPDYQTLMRPVLELSAGRERKVSDCAAELAERFSLTYEEIQHLLPSGRQRTLLNRTHWAATYLAKAGLLERPKRGLIRATSAGEDALRKFPDRIDARVLENYPGFREFRVRSSSLEDRSVDEAILLSSDAEATPQEQISAAYTILHAKLVDDLLTLIVAADPLFFEHLILDLMEAMEYGARGTSRHLGKTGDGGVDGVIDGDPLGLNVIYLQAKKYALNNAIGVQQIREFAGSLDEKRASKGVFVTTTSYTREAVDYASRTTRRIVLIDGTRLCRLLINYGVAVRTSRTIEIKEIDHNYFPTDDIA